MDLLQLKPGDESNGFVTDSIYCLVIIIVEDVSNTAGVQFKIKLFDVFLPLWTADWLYLYLQTYIVNYRNALNRFHVRMNIILLNVTNKLLLACLAHVKKDDIFIIPVFTRAYAEKNFGVEAHQLKPQSM